MSSATPSPRHSGIDRRADARGRGTAEQVQSFRHSAPYIQAHRGRTVVVQFGGELVEEPAFHTLMSDLALIESLGAKVVVVHGARPQIERRLDALGERSTVLEGIRITDAVAIEAVRDAAGEVRLRIEARLAMGLANTPGHEYASAGGAGRSVSVASGNWVTARPLGVRDGVDHQFTGEVRRVDAAAITSALDAGHIVVLPPLGFSRTGELFNLRAEDVATSVAIELGAAKLVLLGDEDGIRDEGGTLVRELTLEQARNTAWARHSGPEPADADAARHRRESARQLRSALHACRNGVRRVHLVSRHVDGALLCELYTRDGVGTMVNADAYDNVRKATLDDIGGILELVEPLERAGLLVARTRETLEQEIDQFFVDERDGAIVGCAAAYDLDTVITGGHTIDAMYATSLGDDERMFELACLAVDERYRRASRGDYLLKAVERHAREEGATHLAVLTTQAMHWFSERGFELAQPASLPSARRSSYNPQRGSKVLIKQL